MCKCVSYEEVRNEIQQHFKKGMLIPVIGSGFTCGCESRSGMVPSGKEYQKYMIDEIVNLRGGDNSIREELDGKQFSDISTIYHKVIPIEDQKTYLRNNFTQVVIDEEKQSFLNVEWPYIYTLNIDDGIEKNSAYKNVINSNRKIWDDIFDEEKCTIKLHGHIEDMLSYQDSNCEIFDRIQYMKSLQDNIVLLDKLRHDYEYLNLLYIGCSLSNEIDILSVTATVSSNGRHYYCTDSQPNEFDLIMLSQYGITHCVIFDSYKEMYRQIADTAIEAKKISISDLDKYKTYDFSVLPEGFEINKSYLFHGKNPVDNQRKVRLPNFFVTRDVTEKVTKNFMTKGTIIWRKTLWFYNEYTNVL